MVDTKTLKETGRNIYSLITLPLAIPTRTKEIIEEFEYIDTPFWRTGISIGNFFIGVPIISLFLYVNDMLPVQIATNAFSLIYELYQYNKEKIKEKYRNPLPVFSPVSPSSISIPSSTPNAKPSNLEVKATETPKIETPSEKLINPWDVEIPTFKETMLEDRR